MKRTFTALALALVAFAACSKSNTPAATQAAPSPSASTSQAAVTAAPVESSPPGDIPDTQQFVDYTSTVGHYTSKVPEGWARTEKGSSVTFSDKLHSLAIELKSASGPPTTASVQQNEVPELKRTVPAYEQILIKTETLPGGPSVLLRYRMNSAPNDVTGKSTRMEVDRHDIYANGHIAVLSLTAVAGSDNVDVWRLVSQSFRWTSP